MKTLPSQIPNFGSTSVSGGFRRALTLCALLQLSGCITPEEPAPPPGITRDQRAPLGFFSRFWPSIPRRLPSALTGSQFIAQTSGLSAAEREKAILRELRRGNIPSHLRYMHPIKVKSNIDGREIQAILWVTPDYLAIGNDQDFVRIPMNPLTAQRVADQFGMMLPTKKLVDDIYSNSEVKLSPSTMKPGEQMSSNAYFKNHNDAIQKQIQRKNRSFLISGHKKDVVITNRLFEKPRRVAIYGWHRSEDKPIQPLSIVHDQLYADYSHGVRLIAPTILVNGVEMPLSEVLEDTKLSRLVSDEGIIRLARIRTDCL